MKGIEGIEDMEKTNQKGLPQELSMSSIASMPFRMKGIEGDRGHGENQSEGLPQKPSMASIASMAVM